MFVLTSNERNLTMNMRIDDRRVVTRHAIDDCPSCGSECCDGSCQFDELDAEGDEGEADESDI